MSECENCAKLEKEMKDMQDLHDSFILEKGRTLGESLKVLHDMKVERDEIKGDYDRLVSLLERRFPFGSDYKVEDVLEENERLRKEADEQSTQRIARKTQ